jgi:hypothetical protein
MVVAHAIIGFVNASVLRAIRRLPSQTMQERIAKSLLIPLAIGDFSYLFGAFYGMGDVRWKSRDWPQVLWMNVIVGVGIFVPRWVTAVPGPSMGAANPGAGFVGYLVSRDTWRLAIAGWITRIEWSACR